MKNKKVWTVLLAWGVSAVLWGCSLAVEESGEETGQDRLIGALITEEYLDLFDFESYMEDHAAQWGDGEEITLGRDSRYEGKLYAVIDKHDSGNPEDWQVNFEGIRGIRFFSPVWKDEDGESVSFAELCDDGMSDVDYRTEVTDEGESRSQSGTLYVLPGMGDEDSRYYVNPVYQDGEGEIYVMANGGFSASYDSEEGEKVSTTVSDQVRITENEKSKTEKSSVTVRIAVMYRPVKITLYQMDADNQIVNREEYVPGQLPEKLSAGKETAYFLVETQRQDPEGHIVTGRRLLEREDSELSDTEEACELETFYAGENGVIQKQATEVYWM